MNFDCGSVEMGRNGLIEVSNMRPKLVRSTEVFSVEFALSGQRTDNGIAPTNKFIFSARRE
jgi:hypothetical protein